MVWRSFVALQEEVVEQCQEAGLVWGRELYIDGTKVAANAGKESVKPRFAVDEHLRSLFDTEAEEPVDAEQHQKVQEASPPDEKALPALIELPTSLPPEENEAL